MKSCPRCGVTIRQNPARCPLCQGDLSGGAEEVRVFPVVQSVRRRHRVLLRLMIFGTIVAAVICGAINLSFPSGGWWSLFVAAGLASFWLSFAFVASKRGNIPKAILWQVAIISFLAVAWDFATGYHLWSLNYVVPILCTCAQGAMAVSARILRLEIQDYILYLVLDSLFGIIPLAFILLDVVNVVLPSAVCVAVSIISLSALWVFEGAALRAELRGRMHI